VHRIVGEWFAARFGEPTEVQALAWPRIAAGEHVLAIAPTGSGKTLAAFLSAIDRLMTSASASGAVRILYVSPLRALGNDVRRNLLGPLLELRTRFAESGEPAPEIRVATRTGDTPAGDRARMLRLPPEILVTTPESLNVLLTSRRGRAFLGGVETVILDEVHAVAGTKRGALLAANVERLARIAGEFQRIALSATVRPLERVAAWVGGARTTPGGEPAPRPVAVVRSAEPKRYEISVAFPAASERVPAGEAGDAAPPVHGAGGDPLPFWRAVADALRGPLARNRSTLVFANSKRMVEKLTRLLNEAAGEQLVYSHHGALSREVRRVVEERLKRGELRGIVATSSLELGIDIGSLDEVVLAQTPPSLASAAQRIGRAGHAVGGTSRARFLALHPRDLLQAAAAARAVLDGEIEPVRPVDRPLDVLAQAILSMVATEPWPIEALWDVLRGADPFRGLARRPFDLVLEMLAGRFASARVRPLRPLVLIDREAGAVRGLPGAERLVYAGGGTIPDRGYFHLRREGTNALLGELDEEFVWERKVGDTFTLGVQGWRVERITHNDVLVSPSRAGAAMSPFWRAGERDRGFELSERVAALLEEADAGLDDEGFARRLESRYLLEPGAARVLLAYLRAQRDALGGLLPHRHRIVIERVEGAGSASGQTILHTLWGGRVHRPLALALAAAWEARHGAPVEVAHDDDCVAVLASSALDPGGILSLLAGSPVERLVRERLEGTGFFGARFREAAGIALLLPKEGFKRRTPLWLSRQRAKELFEATSRFDDFPIRLEAWRACLADAFDLERLESLLEEVRDGRIEVRVVTTAHPSPFASGVVWKRTNELMYEDDVQQAAGAPPREGLLREVVFAARLRPRIPAAAAEELRRKLQRTWPGYSPGTPDELLSWLEERVAIPREEWNELLAAIERDHGNEASRVDATLGARITAVRLGAQAGREVLVARQALPRVRRALLGEADPDAPDADPRAELLAEVLRFYGPVDPSAPARALGMTEEQASDAIGTLADARRVIVDRLTEGAPALEICDADNLEALLRAMRAGARARFEALPVDRLALFLAEWQGLGRGGSGVAGLKAALEPLLGWAAPAGAWETEILPARLPGYRPEWLDALLAESPLEWTGQADRRIAFALPGDRELFAERAEAGSADADTVLPRAPGRFAFEDLVRTSGLASAELSRRLWELVWRGEVACDGFGPVRRGLATGFEPAEAEPPSAGGAARGRLRFDRWRATRPFGGAWYRLAPPDEPGDAIERDESDKERARLVLARYGVVFRELLEREAPPLRWGRLFRALRLMELSGEVVAGEFFAGVGGLQFALPAALDRLSRGLDDDRVSWVQAADPASPCGLPIAGLDPRLPRRVPGSHAVFHGARLVAVSERRGRSLLFLAAPDDPRLRDYLGFLDAALSRSASPARTLTVETINGGPAATSPHLSALSARFHVSRDATSVTLSRRY
jgi:ATP-dependent Lhr-like helicase